MELEDQTIDLTAAKNVYISLVSDTASIQKKSGDSGVTVEEHRILVYLTQEESSRFADKEKIEMQLNWTYDDRSRVATVIMSKKADRNLLEEVVD
jgi:hypothetical protein